MGLKILKTLGLLIEAKRQGHVHEVKPILDDLIVEAGFRVSQQLYARVMEIAGE